MQTFDELSEINKDMVNKEGLFVGVAAKGIRYNPMWCSQKTELFDGGIVIGYKEKGKYNDLFYVTSFGYVLPTEKIQK